MSEEEIKAIEKLKKDSEILKLELIGFTIKSRIELANSIEIALNYIDKLQKENEELKRKTYKAFINDKGEIQFVFDNYISKDKIRTKIKELSKTQAYKIGLEEYTIKILEELLGE